MKMGVIEGPKKQPGYEVGYGKPPVESRFRPGQSGNPKGRPKGAKNRKPALNEERLKEIVLEEAYRDISVRDGDRTVTVPMAQAILRSIAVNAAKGQHRAQRLFTDLLSTTERQNKELADEWLNTAIGYKVDWEVELHRRERLGIKDLPPPLPHPDQVIIDMDRGTASINGPRTKEEVAELAAFREALPAWKDEATSVARILKRTKDPERRAELEVERAQAEKIVGLIEALLEQNAW